MKLDPAHHEFSLKAHAECHKANTGIFLGLLVLVANLMVTIVYLTSSDESMKEWLYMVGDVSMQCIGIVAVILAFFQTMKLELQWPNRKQDRCGFTSGYRGRSLRTLILQLDA